MGYYTSFELNTMDNKYKISDIISYMKKEYDESRNSKYYPFKYNFEDYIGDESISDFDLYGGECKWYEFDEEMIELSEEFPETVFCLYGNGEESDDMWYKYYKNGKSQYCPARITFDKYDESKLV